MNNKFMREGQSSPSTPKPDINDLPIHVCPQCSNTSFFNAMEIRILSAIVSSSGEVEIIKAPVIVCSLCGVKVISSDIDKSTMRGSKGGTVEGN